MTDALGTDTPIVTAPSAPTIVTHPVVQSVVNSVYADPNVAPQNAAYTVASILQALVQYEPAVLAVSRASPQTTIVAQLATGLLGALISAFFPHPQLPQS